VSVGRGDLRNLRSLLYIAMLVDGYAAAPHLAALARLLRLRFA
jgi:hypothetical protein